MLSCEICGNAADSFFPTADFFATLRRNQASLDLFDEFNLEEEDHGLERFITATRRQNYLIPPRRHRAFPLVELATNRVDRVPDRAEELRTGG